MRLHLQRLQEVRRQQNERPAKSDCYVSTKDRGAICAATCHHTSTFARSHPPTSEWHHRMYETAQHPEGTPQPNNTMQHAARLSNSPTLAPRPARAHNRHCGMAQGQEKHRGCAGSSPPRGCGLHTPHTEHHRPPAHVWRLDARRVLCSPPSRVAIRDARSAVVMRGVVCLDADARV